MKELLLRKVPNLIRWNNLDEHKYLIWPTLVSICALYGISTLLSIPDPIAKVISLSLPIAYYCYLLWVFINYDDFKFDLKSLGLSSSDEAFIVSTSSVYKNKITFDITEFTMEKLKSMSSSDKQDVIDRFFNAAVAKYRFEPNIYALEIYITTKNAHNKNCSNIDFEFTDLFIDRINPSLKISNINGIMYLQQKHPQFLRKQIRNKPIG